MIINDNYPGYHRIQIVDEEGTDMVDEAIKSVDTHHCEYTRYQRDSEGKITGGLELVKAKKITWDWYSKTITIVRDV